MKNSGMKPYMINTLLTIALCAAYCLLGGFLRAAVSVLISALLGVTFYREHYGRGIANSLLLLVIFTLFSGAISALLNGVPIVLLALALALGTRTKLSIYKLLLLCAFLYMADLVISMELLKQMTEGAVSFSSVMLETGNQLREVLKEQYQEPEMAAALEQAVTAAVDTCIMLAPAMLMIFSTAFSYILILIYKKMQNRQETDMSFLLPFDRLQGEGLMAALYLVLLFALTAAPEGLFADAAANVLLFLSFLFVIFGAAVFDYKMKQRGMQKKMRRLLIFVLICFSGVFLMAPVFAFLIAGLSDSFFDHRRLRSKTEEK